eukprot:TRINITY_DN92_c0_g1_i1.p1 TRINITY_DN92_c0_g1~~TRINITY_DN92_c0_g1_i1.p1  ORF type:complete len:241 (-),score=5.63 TRINITY_DN92_c0_g1_i1:51-752(-)
MQIHTSCSAFLVLLVVTYTSASSNTFSFSNNANNPGPSRSFTFGLCSALPTTPPVYLKLHNLLLSLQSPLIAALQATTAVQPGGELDRLQTTLPPELRLTVITKQGAVRFDSANRGKEATTASHGQRISSMAAFACDEGVGWEKKTSQTVLNTKNEHFYVAHRVDVKGSPIVVRLSVDASVNVEIISKPRKQSAPPQEPRMGAKQKQTRLQAEQKWRKADADQHSGRIQMDDL